MQESEQLGGEYFNHRGDARIPCSEIISSVLAQALEASFQNLVFRSVPAANPSPVLGLEHRRLGLGSDYQSFANDRLRLCYSCLTPWNTETVERPREKTLTFSHPATHSVATEGCVCIPGSLQVFTRGFNPARRIRMAQKMRVRIDPYQ